MLISSAGMRRLLNCLILTFLVAASVSCFGEYTNSDLDDGQNQLPGLPGDAGGNPQGGAGAVETQSGSAAVQSRNAAVNGTSLELTAGPANAYALYRFSGLAGRLPQKLVLDTAMDGPDTLYAIGVSDYSAGSWHWLDAGYDLGGDQGFISAAGNLYVLAVVYDAGQLDLNSLELHSTGGQPGPDSPSVTVDKNSMVLDSTSDIYRVRVVDGDNQESSIYDIGTHFEYTTPSGIYIIQVLVQVNAGDAWVNYDFPIPDELISAHESEYYRSIIVVEDYVSDLRLARIWDAEGNQFTSLAHNATIVWQHPDNGDIVRARFYYDCGMFEMDDLSYPENPVFHAEFIEDNGFVIFSGYPDIYKLRVELSDGTIERLYRISQITWTAGPGEFEYYPPVGLSIVSVKACPTPGDEYIEILP